jgi:hypothetical protein
MQGTTEEEIERRIQAISRTLRAKRLTQLSKDTSMATAWVRDPNTTTSMEGGPIAETYDAWLQSLSREGRWACGYTIKACAEALNKDIVIMKWLTAGGKAHWAKVAFFRAEPGKKKQKDPIVVALINGHYQGLKRQGQTWPTELFNVEAFDSAATFGAQAVR